MNTSRHTTSWVFLRADRELRFRDELDAGPEEDIELRRGEKVRLIRGDDVAAHQLRGIAEELLKRARPASLAAATILGVTVQLSVAAIDGILPMSQMLWSNCLRCREA